MKALQALRYVVLDTELTSLDERTNRVLAVGAMAMDGAAIRLGRQFYRVLNPDVTIPPAGVLIHRLTPGEIAAGEPPARALAELLDFVAGAVLVGHFIGIDLAALRKEGRLAGLLPAESRSAGWLRIAGEYFVSRPPINPALDTVRLHRWLDLRRKTRLVGWDHQVTSLDLATVARCYDVPTTVSHQALDDAYTTARLWQKLIYALQEAGVTTLDAALRIGRG
ncbi:MAG TPA: 3'-5' exonuclease [Anaerolineae bacterium]